MGCSKISLADIAFLRAFGGPDGLGADEAFKTQLAAFPTLVKVLANTNANPGIAEHIRNRPETVF